MSRAVVECDECGLPAKIDPNGTVVCAACGRMQRASRGTFDRTAIPAGLLGLDGEDTFDVDELRALRESRGSYDV